jgi:TonB family protein
MVQPIWQVLTELGIEGEYCQSAVDAVEKVTTQLFQIVITDWEDQPEAAFLLKTARDQKAAQRPLTLAIVSDDGRLPEALKAGANSVLVKPLRAEAVRDTMSTACQLLRAKQQPGAKPIATPALAETPATATMAAAASAGAVSAPALVPAAPASVPSSVPVSVPPSVIQPPEKTFRAGEFLQTPNTAPGAQFDTEAESEVQKSLDQAAIAEMDALTELEPTAAAVQEAPAQEPAAQEPATRETATQEPLSGWAALQARLTRTAPPPPVEEAPPKSSLLSYAETSSYGAPTAESGAEAGKSSSTRERQAESQSEAALFAYMPGESTQNSEPAAKPRSQRGRIFVAAILAAAGIALVGMPRARLSLNGGVQSAVRAGRGWLNPAPAPVPQAVPQHDSFGQSGDEYNLPVATNIPDATTDPSQIRVVPVIDPTAKPDKAGANGGQAQAAPGDIPSADQNQAGARPGEQAGENSANDKDPATTSANDALTNTAHAAPGAVAPAATQPSAPAAQATAPQPQPTAPAMPNRSQNPAPVPSSVGIPSSLKSQMASSTTPDASGNKPPEAAMSSIEPVVLPEAAVRDLLAQPVDPVYPDAAKASGQRGSVVLQVLIGRDGAVQDAKFLQGSLIFARAAIDAVKQWHFKPYSMNGRAVSVQSVMTLKFQPPA